MQHSTGVQAVQRRTFLEFYDDDAVEGPAVRCRCSTDSFVRYADAVYPFKKQDDSGDESSITEAGTSDSWADVTDDEVEIANVGIHTEGSLNVGLWADAMDEPDASQAPEVRRPPGQFTSTHDAMGKSKSAPPFLEVSDHTCVMIRNFPKRLTRAGFVEMLDKVGFQGKYDFVYMPIDFRKLTAIGYAFVNLTSHDEAVRMMQHFDCCRNWDGQGLETDLAGSVCWSAVQGLAANVERYRNSAVMHGAVPEEYKPLVLRKGRPVRFPASTRKVRVPRKSVFKDC